MGAAQQHRLGQVQVQGACAGPVAAHGLLVGLCYLCCCLLAAAPLVMVAV